MNNNVELDENNNQSSLFPIWFPPKLMNKTFVKEPDLIKINVGGKIYTTKLEIIQNAPKESLLYQSFFNENCNQINTDENSIPFFDGNGKLFNFILHYLRRNHFTNNLSNLEKEMLLKEAEFFGIEELVQYLKKKPIQLIPFTQAKIINYINQFRKMKTPLNLKRVNLSELSLSSMILKNSLIKDSCFNETDCSKTDFTGTNLIFLQYFI